MVARFRSGDGEVVLVATVQGLVSERDRVLALLDSEKPTIVALAQSPESVATLLQYAPPEDHDPFEELADHDFVFSLKLREYGEIALPPPDLQAALTWARDAGATYYGVDLADEAYESLFIKEVSTFGFLRYGRIQRSLAKRPPKAKDAKSFSLAWDAKIRKVKGIARVEAAREAHIAEHALRLAREQAGKVFLLVDVAREAGISRRLSGE